MTDLRVVHVLWPGNWRETRRVLGEHAIERGTKLARDGQIREAFAYLNAGLRRAPRHRDGRLLAAELNALVQNVDHARELLLAGLEHHRDDPEYVSVLFRLLLSQQEDERVIALATTLLETAQHRPDLAHACALASATASYHRGEHDQAEQFLRSHPKLDTRTDARVLYSKIEWERGYRQLALLILRQLAQERPADANVHSELQTRLRESGLFDEARHRALAFRIANPENTRASVDLLYAYQNSGDIFTARAEAERILNEARESATLIAVADFAAHAGAAELAQRVIALAKNDQHLVLRLSFLHVEALLTAKEYSRALAALRSVSYEARRSREYSALLDGLNTVAYLGAGDLPAARAAIQGVLDQTSVLRSENLLLLANRCVTLDAPEEACRILEKAVTIDPLNQAALSRLIELELHLGRTSHVPQRVLRLVKMRKPSSDLLRVAQFKLETESSPSTPERTQALEAIQATLRSRARAFAKTL